MSELEKLRDELDCLEAQIDEDNEQLKRYNEDDPQFEYWWHQITEAENEARYIQQCIEELENDT